jgi:ribosomal protein S20
MAPGMATIRKTAERYVKTQVKTFANGGAEKISQKDLDQAISKVVQALTEIHHAIEKTKRNSA